jgi:hypothetical protein
MDIQADVGDDLGAHFARRNVGEHDDIGLPQVQAGVDLEHDVLPGSGPTGAAAEQQDCDRNEYSTRAKKPVPICDPVHRSTPCATTAGILQHHGTEFNKNRAGFGAHTAPRKDSVSCSLPGAPCTAKATVYCAAGLAAYVGAMIGAYVNGQRVEGVVVDWRLMTVLRG